MYQRSVAFVLAVICSGCGGTSPPAGPASPPVNQAAAPDPVLVSDAAAVTAAAGAWEVITINGKPLPFRYPVGALFKSSRVAIRADGGVTATDTYDDDPPKITTGTLFAADTRLTFVMAGGAATMTIAADTITRVTSGDVYIYKRTGPLPADPTAEGPVLAKLTELADLTLQTFMKSGEDDQLNGFTPMTLPFDGREEGASWTRWVSVDLKTKYVFALIVPRDVGDPSATIEVNRVKTPAKVQLDEKAVFGAHLLTMTAGVGTAEAGAELRIKIEYKGGKSGPVRMIALRKSVD
jgi:hypothetical protein